ncbi:MAG: hypothetical protein KF688_14850 [Pirellulales bacterium]|nr:hypothetical protein [Pirellulales bacterium]
MMRPLDSVDGDSVSASTAGPPRAIAGEIGDSLDERARFEQLLIELTATFINLPSHEIDDQIETALRRLGEFLGVGRSSFAEFSPDKLDMVVTHCYVAPGVEPFPLVIVEERLPWYARQIRAGRVLRFQRLPDELPPEATAERDYCVQNGLKSNLAIPLSVNGSLRCVVTFSTFGAYRDWPDELVERLRLIGDVFAGALQRRNADQRLLQLHEQLTRLGRAKLLGELAASIAHEITQPLCAIVSNAQAGLRMIAKDPPDLAEIRAALGDIAADSRRANEIVKRIRNMLQSRPLQRTAFDFPQAVCEVVELLRDRLRRHDIDLALALDPQLPHAYGDRVQLQQVLLNLALNAVEAMQDHKPDAKELEISAAPLPEGGVRIAIQDSGPGVAGTDLGQIFDPFYTTKSGGLGMGLAICRTIVEAHGGRLWLEANASRGARFVLTIPAAEASP